MREILTLLIKDDIKQTRLVRTLDRVNIDATDYLRHTSSIIFKLVNVDLSIENEPLSNSYYQKIEKAVKDRPSKEAIHIREIIEWLKVFSKAEIN